MNERIVSLWRVIFSRHDYKDDECRAMQLFTCTMFGTSIDHIARVSIDFREAAVKSRSTTQHFTTRKHFEDFL